MKEASFHLTLLAQNSTGFKNLVKMASRAFLEGFYFKPRIDKELLEAHSEGIICLSGCVSGEFSRTILQQHGDLPDLTAGHGNRRLVSQGVRRSLLHRDSEQRAGNPAAGHARRGGSGQALGLPLVATSDAHYVNREDAEAQDVLLCINTGKFRTDKQRMRMEGDQFFLRSAEEMFEALCAELCRRAGPKPADRRLGRHPARPRPAALSHLHAAAGNDRQGLSARPVHRAG